MTKFAITKNDTGELIAKVKAQDSSVEIVADGYKAGIMEDEESTEKEGE